MKIIHVFFCAKKEVLQIVYLICDDKWLLIVCYIKPKFYPFNLSVVLKMNEKIIAF